MKFAMNRECRKTVSNFKSQGVTTSSNKSSNHYTKNSFLINSREDHVPERKNSLFFKKNNSSRERP